jgi:hypothetical protein
MQDRAREHDTMLGRRARDGVAACDAAAILTALSLVRSPHHGSHFHEVAAAAAR